MAVEKSKRSFIYITDVVEATYKLCNKSKNGEIYHISTNKLVSIKDLVEMIFKLKKVSSKKYINIALIELERIVYILLIHKK